MYHHYYIYRRFVKIFSAVIPLYNKQKHIKSALDSVLGQLYEPSEIIIINDGSTDKGPDIVKACRDLRIMMITQQNKGPASARNTGIRIARYPFIAFLDADDEWKPDFLKSIKGLIREFPGCGLYATGYDVIRKTGSIQSITARSLSPGWKGILENYFKTCLKDQVVCSSSTVMPKSTFSKTGFFKEHAKRGEDLDMWARTALISGIAYYNTPCAVRHLDADNRTAENEEPRSFVFLEEAEKNRNYPYLSEYTAKVQLIYIEYLLRNSAGAKARETLKSIKGTEIYKNRYRFFYILSFLPGIITRSVFFILRVFSFILRRLRRLTGRTCN